MNKNPKVLFIYPGYIVGEQPLCVQYLIAGLKKIDIETRLFHLTPYRKRPYFGDPHRIIRREFMRVLHDFQPDIVGISTMTINFATTREMCKWVKGYNSKIITILGGIHPTIEPEGSIKEKNVDMICVGEGDEAVPELLEKMRSGIDYTDTASFWFKKDGEIIRNEPRPLVQDLDSLPFADRDCLESEYMDAELFGVNMHATRGCPYPCTYCQNKFLMELYKGKGSFCRYRSYENIFAELDELITKYKIKNISFSDETFSLNKKWLYGFLKEYKKRFALPFVCQTRPDLVDREMLQAMKDAGCQFINMAIESGNEQLRKNVLHRNISREKMVQAFRVAREVGIQTGAYNIIGIPGETIENVWETIDINQEINADRIFCTVFMPFKGTSLGEEMLSDEKNILMPVEDAEIYYSTITVKHKTLTPRLLLGYQGFFDYYVRLSKKFHFAVHGLRYFYQLLPPVHKAGGIIRAIREMVIESVYHAKRFLPTPGGFYMKRL